MLSARTIFVLLVALSFTFIFLGKSEGVDAAVSSCNVAVSPSSVSASSIDNFSFSVTNTGGVSYAWVKVTRPSSNFTLNSHTVSGWNVDSFTSSELVLTGGTLGPSNGFSITIQATSGSSGAASANWAVQVSDDEGGASPFSCTGDLSTSIDAPPSAISNLRVSEVSDTSVKITWTTDTNADSEVIYGTTDGYGSTKSDGTLTTSHSVTLSGLAANTTYHYSVNSTDSGSNVLESADNTFVTAKTVATTTASNAATPTPTPRLTPTTTSGPARKPATGATPTPTPAPPNRSAPSVTITTDLTEPFTEAPAIAGRASDPETISRIQYSTDNGRNWLTVETVRGLNTAAATFTFTPLLAADDNYQVVVRAFDGNGNVGVSRTVTVIIDRLPSHVGPVLFSFGAQPLTPEEDGHLLTMVGLEQRVTLSASGGPTTVDLTSGEQVFSLVKNIDTGLWSGVISFAEPGTYELAARLVDGGGEEIIEPLTRIAALGAGRITSESGQGIAADVTLYYVHPITRSFVPWDAASFGQQNPQPTDEDGGFVLVPPPGTYYLMVESAGYRPFRSHIFSLDRSVPLNVTVALQPAPTLALGPWRLPLPTFGPVSQAITLQPVEGSAEVASSPRLGSELPFVALPSGAETFYSSGLKGKPSIVTLLATWLPQTTEQLQHLQQLQTSDIHLLVVMSQEGASATDIWRRRGQYTLPIAADPAGEFMRATNQHHVPTHLILDRQGKIQAIRSGVVSAAELTGLVQSVVAL